MCSMFQKLLDLQFVENPDIYKCNQCRMQDCLEGVRTNYLENLLVKRHENEGNLIWGWGGGGCYWQGSDFLT